MGFTRFASMGFLAVLAMCLVSTDAFAQRRGGFMPESNLNLLLREGVQKELDLVEDQVDQLKELNDEMRSRMREVFVKMRDEGWQNQDRAKMFEKIQGEMKIVNKEFDEQTREILLDHQISRLEQIRIQSENRRNGGASSGSLSPLLIEKLKISEDQLEEIKKKAAEVKKKMDEKIAKIRKQAEEEVLSVLSPDQRAQYKEMVGDAYKFEDRRQMFGRGGPGTGGRGGAGGRGGNRGGDRGGDRGGQRRDDF